MNELILKEMNENRIVYFYHPNGDAVFGVIEYLFSDKQAYISRKADNDESGYFAQKLHKKWRSALGKTT